MVLEKKCDQKSITYSDVIGKWMKNGSIDYDDLLKVPKLGLQSFRNLECNMQYMVKRETKYCFPELMSGFKKKHLWIVGSPSSGKSMLKQYFMSQGCCICDGPCRDGWWPPEVFLPEYVTVWMEEVVDKLIADDVLLRLCDGNW